MIEILISYSTKSVHYNSDEQTHPTVSGDAGMDISSAVDIVVPPNSEIAVPTGMHMAIPFTHFGSVRSRSGLRFKHGIEAFDGTIDSGYRGEIMVLLINHRETEYQVKRGDRIAQMVFLPSEPRTITLIDKLPSSQRGVGGFGHTGR